MLTRRAYNIRECADGEKRRPEIHLCPQSKLHLPSWIRSIYFSVLRYLMYLQQEVNSLLISPHHARCQDNIILQHILSIPSLEQALFTMTCDDNQRDTRELIIIGSSCNCPILSLFMGHPLCWALSRLCSHSINTVMCVWFTLWNPPAIFEF